MTKAGERLISSAKQAAEMVKKNGWQSIASAPRDGTNIVVAGDLHHDPMYGVAHWHEGGWHMWWDLDLRAHEWPEFWMPLPEPPE